MDAALQQLPDSPHLATVSTLAEMTRLAVAAARDPNFILFARDVVADVAPHDYPGELAAVFDWLKNSFRYVRDPYGLEMVQGPRETLKIKSGDCDDLSTLSAAVLLSIGYPTRFAVSGNGGGMWQHVWTEAMLPDGRWIPLDTVAYGETRGLKGRGTRLDAAAFGLYPLPSLSGATLGFVPAVVSGSLLVDEFLRDHPDEKAKKAERNAQEILDDLLDLENNLDALEDFDPDKWKEQIEGELDYDAEDRYFSDEVNKQFGDFWDKVPGHERIAEYIDDTPILGDIKALLEIGISISGATQTILKGDSQIKTMRAKLLTLADFIEKTSILVNRGSAGKARASYYRKKAKSTKTKRNHIPDGLPGSTVKKNRKNLRKWIKKALTDINGLLRDLYKYLYHQAEQNVQAGSLYLAFVQTGNLIDNIRATVDWANKNYPASRRNDRDAYWNQVAQLKKLLPELRTKEVVYRDLWKLAKAGIFDKDTARNQLNLIFDWYAYNPGYKVPSGGYRDYEVDHLAENFTRSNRFATTIFENMADLTGNVADVREEMQQLAAGVPEEQIQLSLAVVTPTMRLIPVASTSADGSTRSATSTTSPDSLKVAQKKSLVAPVLFVAAVTGGAYLWRKHHV